MDSVLSYLTCGVIELMLNVHQKDLKHCVISKFIFWKWNYPRTSL